MSRIPSLRFFAFAGLFSALALLPPSAHSVEKSSADEAHRPRLFEPAPRTEDGRFTNWVGELPHGTLGTRLPFFGRRLAGFFRSRPGIPERLSDAAERLAEWEDPETIESPEASAATVTWIGHSTLLVQMEGIRFLTDPTWSEHPSPISWLGPRRFVAPGLSLDELPPIDFVVISHNHYDHLDLPTLRALAERNSDLRFYVPLGNGPLLRKKGLDHVVELDWGETVEQGGVVVHCLPAQHWSKRGLTDNLKALWASWAVVGQNHRFYHSGDSGYFKGFKEIGEKLGPFDLVGVAVGAYEPRAMMESSHMNPEEAFAAARDLGAKRALAMHFGTFDLSDEPLDESPRRFQAAAESAGEVLEPTVPWVFLIGETRSFKSGDRAAAMEASGTEPS